MKALFNIKIILVILFGFYTKFCGAAVSQARVFSRCYAIFVDERVPPTHDLLVQVKNGLKTGVDACMDLLNRALLRNNGLLVNDSAEARKILSTFQRIHNKFFFPTNMSSYRGYEDHTWELIDPNQAGYYVTRSLFRTDIPVRSIVTEEVLLEGVRETSNRQFKPNTTSSYIGVSQNTLYPDWRAFGQLFTPTLYEVGALRGVRASTRQLIHDRNGDPLYFDDHFGGGVLGTQMYFSKAAPSDFGSTSFAHRRLTQQLVKDFLCGDLPTLAATDVTAYVDNNAPNSFQQQASCVRCHQTMDNLAGAFRNHYKQPIGNLNADNNGSISNKAEVLAAKPITLAAETNIMGWDVASLPHSGRPPRGKFVYRDMSNRSYNLVFNNLTELGQILAGWKKDGSGPDPALANFNDFYACMVSKYAEHLIGVRTPMYNREALGAPNLSAVDADHRQFIEATANQVRTSTNQDIRIAIRAIIERYVTDEFYGLRKRP